MAQHPVYTAVVLDSDAPRTEKIGTDFTVNALCWQKRLWKFKGIDPKTKLPRVGPLAETDYSTGSVNCVFCKLDAPGNKEQQVSAQIKVLVDIGRHSTGHTYQYSVPECFHDYASSEHVSAVLLA
jgi:hypothetical protein